MPNLHRQFQGLIPKPALRVGQVAAHNSDGTSTLTIAGGATVRVRGQSVAIGQKAFFQGRELRGPAPNLATTSVTLA